MTAPEQPPKRRGRPPGTAEPSVATSIRIPESLHAEWKARGATRWLVAELRKPRRK